MIATSEYPSKRDRSRSYQETGVPKKASILLDNVEKIYTSGGQSFSALKRINARFYQGEYIGIIGKSGAGKTTLVNMLSGVDQITSGQVIIDDISIHALDETRMALWRGQNMGIVFQFFQLLPMLNLLDNIMLPMDFCHRYHPRKSREKAMHLLKMVELEDHAFKLPSAISGGQQQRVAIARALANDPPIIVADEPTGSLDSSTAETIYHIFDDLVAQGKTVIIVSHDTSLTRRVSRKILLFDGEIIDENVAELFSHLSHRQMMDICHEMQTYTYQPGEIIYQAGNPLAYFYIIQEGQVDIYAQNKPGSRKLIGELIRGDTLGEIEYLENDASNLTYLAAGDSPLYLSVLSRERFSQVIDASVEFKNKIAESAGIKRALYSSNL